MATGECTPWQPPTQPDLSFPVALATVVTSSLLLLHTPAGVGRGWEQGMLGVENLVGAGSGGGAQKSFLEGGMLSWPCGGHTAPSAFLLQIKSLVSRS